MNKKIKYSRNYVIKGVVVILLLSFMLNYISIKSFAMPAKAYSKIMVKNVESTDAITSSDAKFMNGHIIAGVSGSLTVLNLDRSIVAKFPEVKVNWIGADGVCK